MLPTAIDLSCELTSAGLQVQVTAEGATFQREVPPSVLDPLVEATAQVRSLAESGKRPLVDPMVLRQLGKRLRDECLPSELLLERSALAVNRGQITISAASGSSPDLLWEALVNAEGEFLVANGLWSIRRHGSFGAGFERWQPRAGPLRVLFVASSPEEGRRLPTLDFEKEEEAILDATRGLEGDLHLEIALTGTMEELRELVISFEPHVVHLSGHGRMHAGVGSFCFENERGRLDERTGSEIASTVFASGRVGCVFVSACQSAQSGVAGLCQSLLQEGGVPIALGWGASISDSLATVFAAAFYHELALGCPVDQAVSVARRKLFGHCRTRLGTGREVLDASFLLPELHTVEDVEELADKGLPARPPPLAAVTRRPLGDNINGLREGFVGRRRILQRLQPALRTGETAVVVLTGIGGAGKSTLATRLANRCEQDGWRVVPLRAREDEHGVFGLRLLEELAVACERMARSAPDRAAAGLEADARTLRDGERPIEQRFRLAIEILNERRLVLVLDNLETLLTPPPGPFEWIEPTVAFFFHELGVRLTGEGRAILTCRYLPPGIDPESAQVQVEPMPDFTEANFEKYLRRDPKLASRRIPEKVIKLFHRKFGATPRFIEQACAVLATIPIDELEDQLEAAPETRPADGELSDPLRRLQQDYFDDLFLVKLVQALPAGFQTALRRVAVLVLPVPLDGIVAVVEMGAAEVDDAIDLWLEYGLIQRWVREEGTLYAIYPLQRDFLLSPDDLPIDLRNRSEELAAGYFRAIHESDRGRELGIGWEAGLFTCLWHATRSKHEDLEVWAIGRLGNAFVARAEYRAASDLVGASEFAAQRPELLALSGDIHLRTGDWKLARSEFTSALEMRQAIGDRAGEAATWHQLGSIELHEGNYGSAREKFGKTLEMRQAIGDRAGEAATLYQIGGLAWQKNRKTVAIELAAICLGIQNAIGAAGEAKVTMNQLAGMAGELALSQEQLQTEIKTGLEEYQQDRGARLVAAAFKGLSD